MEAHDLIQLPSRTGYMAPRLAPSRQIPPHGQLDTLAELKQLPAVVHHYTISHPFAPSWSLSALPKMLPEKLLRQQILGYEPQETTLQYQQ